jgi:hypothetical protein
LYDTTGAALFASGNAGYVQFPSAQAVTLASTTITGTVAATQSGTWNVTNISGTVSLPTGASTSALQTTGNTALTTINTTLGSPFQAGGSIGNTSFAVTQGTSSNLKGQFDPLTIASWGLMSGTVPGTAPTNTQITGGIYNSSAPTLTTGQTAPFQFTAAGSLHSTVDNTSNPVTPGNGITAPTGTAPSTSAPVTSFNEMYNGSTWDALQGDANKNLKVNLQASGDPCMGQAKTPLAINQNTTSSVQLVALSGSTKIYICSLFLMTNSTATTVALTTGTGTACASSNAAVIGSTTANIANSVNLIAGSGLTYGNGAGTIAAGAASSELCMVLGSNVYVSGNLTYVQQ